MNEDKNNTKNNKLEFNTYCIFTEEKQDIRDTIGLLFKDYLESIKDSHPDLFTTNENFNSEVESTGKCSKFVLNSENGSVRIPKGDSNNYIVIKSFEKKFEFNQPFSLLEPNTIP